MGLAFEALSSTENIMVTWPLLDVDPLVKPVHGVLQRPPQSKPQPSLLSCALARLTREERVPAPKDLRHLTDVRVQIA